MIILLRAIFAIILVAYAGGHHMGEQHRRPVEHTARSHWAIPGSSLRFSTPTFAFLVFWFWVGTKSAAGSRALA
jgi:hypothetical protein